MEYKQKILALIVLVICALAIGAVFLKFKSESYKPAPKKSLSTETLLMVGQVEEKMDSAYKSYEQMLDENSIEKTESASRDVRESVKQAEEMTPRSDEMLENLPGGPFDFNPL